MSYEFWLRGAEHALVVRREGARFYAYSRAANAQWLPVSLVLRAVDPLTGLRVRVVDVDAASRPAAVALGGDAAFMGKEQVDLDWFAVAWGKTADAEERYMRLRGDDETYTSSAALEGTWLRTSKLDYAKARHGLDDAVLVLFPANPVWARGALALARARRLDLNFGLRMEYAVLLEYALGFAAGRAGADLPNLSFVVAALANRFALAHPFVPMPLGESESYFARSHRIISHALGLWQPAPKLVGEIVALHKANAYALPLAIAVGGIYLSGLVQQRPGAALARQLPQDQATIQAFHREQRALGRRWANGLSDLKFLGVAAYYLMAAAREGHKAADAALALPDKFGDYARGGARIVAGLEPDGGGGGRALEVWNATAHRPYVLAYFYDAFSRARLRLAGHRAVYSYINLPLGTEAVVAYDRDALVGAIDQVRAYTRLCEARKWPVVDLTGLVHLDVFAVHVMGDDTRFIVRDPAAVRRAYGAAIMAAALPEEYRATRGRQNPNQPLLNLYEAAAAGSEMSWSAWNEGAGLFPALRDSPDFARLVLQQPAAELSPAAIVLIAMSAYSLEATLGGHMTARQFFELAALSGMLSVFAALAVAQHDGNMDIGLGAAAFGLLAGAGGVSFRAYKAAFAPVRRVAPGAFEGPNALRLERYAFVAELGILRVTLSCSAGAEAERALRAALEGRAQVDAADGEVHVSFFAPWKTGDSVWRLGARRPEHAYQGGVFETTPAAFCEGVLGAAALYLELSARPSDEAVLVWAFDIGLRSLIAKPFRLQGGGGGEDAPQPPVDVELAVREQVPDGLRAELEALFAELM